MEIHRLPLIQVREKVQEHIFNRMPIRVLGFDSHGGQVQLLERSTISSLVLSRIRDEYPDGVPVKNVEDVVGKASRYAILSHTWIRDSPGDIVYSDWNTNNFQQHTRGYQKITNFCKVAAREHNVLFGWMDTVCINKNSSSELDESIRSMYKWYQGAHVCVIYLAETSVIKEMYQDPWFTRGWTLQELLAPKHKIFHNRIWKLLIPQDSTPSLVFNDQEFNRGWKNVSTPVLIPLELQYQIFKATTITRRELEPFYFCSKPLPPSRVLQLAAQRTVTREEDGVYSLMGLLGVGITIAYGEGSSSSLKRLIREIMLSKPEFMDIFNHTNAHSIIATDIRDYTKRSTAFDDNIYSGRLDLFPQPEPVVLTHMGVRLTVLAVPAFRRVIYEHIIPSESRSHIVTMPPVRRWRWLWENPQDYILLDHSNSSADWITGLPTVATNNVSSSATPRHGPPAVIFMAIIGSCVDPEDGLYKLPANSALCIAISNDNINGKKLIDIMPNTQISGPMTIPLPFSTNQNYESTLSMSREEAGRLGFKTITQYFT